MQTELGQMLDLWTNRTDNEDYRQCTTTYFNYMAVNKTAYYTFALPICFGLFIAGACTAENVSQTTDICEILGLYFQIQVFYLPYSGS